MEQIQALVEVQASLLMLLDCHQGALVSDQDLLVTTSRYDKFEVKWIPHLCVKSRTFFDKNFTLQNWGAAYTRSIIIIVVVVVVVVIIIIIIFKEN
jgi:hypothetical protein